MLKKVKLINHDCLPISMQLYTMMCIMLAYLMLFTSLSSAASLQNAYLHFYFLGIDFCKCFLFHKLSLGLLTHSLFISSMIFHHVQCFNLLVFLILCSHHFLCERAMCSLEK